MSQKPTSVEVVESANGEGESGHFENPLEEREEPDFKWNRDVFTNLFALYTMYFACTWAMSVPSSSIAFILAEYPTGQALAPWIAATTSLSVCVISVFTGDLSDIFGRRWFLYLASVAGAVGLIVAGRATSVPMIIAGQVISGIGLTVGYLATPLLAEAVPKRWRAPVVRVATMFVSVSGVGGQLSQGAFMKHGVGGQNRGWRIGFYLGGGFFALSLTSILLFYRPGKRPNPEGYSTKTQLLKIDWLGIFLGASGLLLLLLGMQFGGQPEYPWDSAMVICLLVIGTVVLLVFGVREWKRTKDGLFPRQLFAHRNYTISLVLNFIEGMLIFSVQAFMPQIILITLTTDFFLSVVYNLPNALFTMVAAVGFSWIAAKTREAKWVALCSLSCLILGSGLMALMQPDINYAAYAIPACLIGAGICGLGVIIPIISTLCTPDCYIAASVSIGTSCRGLGGAIGLVIFTQTFNSKLAHYLPKAVSTFAIKSGLEPSTIPTLMQAVMTQDYSILEGVPGVTEQFLGGLIGARAQAYADAYRYIWYATIPFGVVSTFITLFLKSTKDQMTLSVASRVQARHPVPEAKEEKEEY
ncbi:hypothetical protein CEP53_007376 [Fusarium sp. AF-6]|nr:hypothetical protein CEP53_007376 [Fusarium sp. AF-6]